MPTRWTATATYKTENGDVGVEHDIDEIKDLQDLIERGPDWNTLKDIRIVYNHTKYPNDTLEASERR